MSKWKNNIAPRILLSKLSMPLSMLLMMLILFSMDQKSYAQQDYHFTQFNFNKFAINPGYAGSREVLSMTALYRHQWTGFEGAPRTISFSAHSPVADQRLALGLLVFSDRLGVSSQTALYFTAAYRLPLGGGVLSTGIQGGFLNYKNAVTELNPHDPGDGLLVNDISVFAPNVGAGVYWSDERTFVGISVPHMVKNDLTPLGDLSDSKTAFLYRHFYVMGGHVVTLSDNVKMRPSVLFKWVSAEQIDAPFDFDFNLSFLLMDKIWLGGAYRLNDSFDLNSEYQLTDQLMVGYSYDFTLTDLSKVNSGSHEVMVRYELSFDKKGWVTPRYMHYF
jgi:type IX secretion system PorP/SprF family membrane protein